MRIKRYSGGATFLSLVNWAVIAVFEKKAQDNLHEWSKVYQFKFQDKAQTFFILKSKMIYRFIKK